MIEALLWIIGSYGTCIALVHIAHAWGQRKVKPIRHFVLVSHNNQLQVEWYVRLLLLFAWVKGQPMKITVVDEGSTDDTISIVSKIKRYFGADLTVLHGRHHIELIERQREREKALYRAEEELIVIELNNADDLAKLPRLQW